MSLTVGRRQFLEQLGRSGAALAAGSWLASIGYVAAAGPARAIVNQARVRSELDRRLFGAFLEHLGRAVYTGVYEPGSPLADANGFRTRRGRTRSRASACRSCAIPAATSSPATTGSMASGPRTARPTVLERAWNSLETNQFGTNEFIEWCRAGRHRAAARLQPGHRHAGEAVAYVEYCNVDKGTKWSDLRRAHGYEQPHNVRTWCLGNEMDGPWQMGTCRPATTAARRATPPARCACSTARLQLIACGSSNTILPTYLVWDREVLEECYDQVDAHLAAQLLRQHAGAHRQQHRPLPGDEPRHGAADPRDRRGLRLRAGPAQVAEAAVAVVRRMERLVPRARRRLRRRQAAPRRRSCSRRSTTSRTRCWSAASSTRCCGGPIACASAAWPRSST